MSGQLATLTSYIQQLSEGPSELLLVPYAAVLMNSRCHLSYPGPISVYSLPFSLRLSPDYGHHCFTLYFFETSFFFSAHNLGHAVFSLNYS